MDDPLPLPALLEALRLDALDLLVPPLGLRPLPSLHLDGQLRDGQPVRLRSLRFAGGPLAVLHLATITAFPPSGPAESLLTLTLAAYPADGLPGPILGMDLIALGGALNLAALDLSSVHAPFWEQHCRPVLADLRQALAPHSVIRRVPDFAAAVLSPLVSLVAARRGHEAQVLHAARKFLQQAGEIYLASASAPLPAPEAAAVRQLVTRWRHAQRENRKEKNALAALFGPEPARRYLEEHFFADHP